MTEPTVVSVPLHVLQDIKDKILEGYDPKVVFSNDPSLMLQEAYKKRGDLLSYTISQINIFILK